MKSVKTKIIVLVLSCLFLSSLAIGATSMINSMSVIHSDSSQIMNLLCSKKSNSINSILEQIEQSVTTLSVYALDQIDNVDLLLNSQTYIDEYTAKLKDVAINAANNTKGAITVYIRFNPEFASPTSGLFAGKNTSSGIFQPLPPTDLSRYDSSDQEHVGWFYEPAQQKKPLWMAPYLNNNINVKMISYVVPLYKNQHFIGVVGMDIDFKILQDTVSSTTVYDRGYAFLTTEDAVIVYHKDLKPGTDLKTWENNELNELANTLSDTAPASALISYQYNGESRMLAFQQLSNNMRFAITAPTSEINAEANNLVFQIIVGTLLVMIVASILTILYTRKMVAPLLELNEAAKKIAGGDFSIDITHHSDDEVGMLAESFRLTMNHLHRYISYINELAYRDPLTGSKNKTAYLEVSAQLDEMVRLKRPEFAVIVLDINGLKDVNDTLGHDYGDMLIADSCKIMFETFKKSPVYRIGGDEFVIILENSDYNNYNTLLMQFDQNIKTYNSNPRNNLNLSIARGIAIFSQHTDLTYHDVFKRADHSMYMNKAEMKKHLNH